MLKDTDVIATIGVKDMDAAKKFYSETLGLTQGRENEGGVIYECGDSQLFVYQSEYAGTNQATAASWNVKNIEEVVEDLKSRGVTFEHYEFEWATLKGDIHLMGGEGGNEKAAWFKDPDGNILNLAQGI